MAALNGSWRRLTDLEKGIIKKLLSIQFPGRDALLSQLESLVASQLDEDGTVLDENGSLYLKTESPIRAEVKTRVPTEGKAVDLDGITIHYLLFVNDEGKMDQLEIYKDDLSKVLRKVEHDQIEVIINYGK